MVRASILFLGAFYAGCTCAGDVGPSPTPAETPPAPAGANVAPAEAAPSPAPKGVAVAPAAADPAANPNGVKPAPSAETPKPSPAALPEAATVGSVERAAEPSPDASAYQVVEIPRDVAAVEGRVTWTRAVPAPVTYKVPEDAQDACGDSQRYRPVEVDSTGGVLGAVVRLPGVTQGRAFFKAPGMTPTFTLSDCALSPRTLGFQVGGTLRVVNRDPVDHTLVARRGGKTLFTLKVKAGETAERKVSGTGFTELRGGPGREWMRGWVHTGPHPYVAVTAAGGSYRLASVLRGSHSAEVWHPALEEGGAPVVVRRALTVDRWLAAHAEFDLAP